MSSFKAKIVDIVSFENLHLIKCQVDEIPLSMITLELHESVQIGESYAISVKPTNVVLAKEITSEITIANQLPCRIDEIKQGVVLSSIRLYFFDYTLESIITTPQLVKLGIKKGDNIYAYINESDLSILC